MRSGGDRKRSREVAPCACPPVWRWLQRTLWPCSAAPLHTFTNPPSSPWARYRRCPPLDGCRPQAAGTPTLRALSPSPVDPIGGGALTHEWRRGSTRQRQAERRLTADAGRRDWYSRGGRAACSPARPRWACGGDSAVRDSRVRALGGGGARWLWSPRAGSTSATLCGRHPLQRCAC